MVPVRPMALDSQICILQYQLQRCLDRMQLGRFEVRTDGEKWMRLEGFGAIPLAGFAIATLSVLESVKPESVKPESVKPDAKPAIRWVIDVAEPGASSAGLPAKSLNERTQRCARLKVADYWLLNPDQSALQTYCLPSPSGYRQQRLWHVGEQVSPTAIPEMTLRIQEPLPLYFLTRTLKGQRTYPSNALPLQVCSATMFGHE
jgi:hypothetical protein